MIDEERTLTAFATVIAPSFLRHNSKKDWLGEELNQKLK
jgi:hypothetical protein